MLPVEIRPHVFWVGVNDRSTEYFEGMWDIRNEGISYNSYLIIDEKKALIDLSKELTTDQFLTQVSQTLDLSSLDYVIINHMEPDHTGALLALCRLAPQATLLGTQKACDMLASFYGITSNVKAVADGETLSLGEHTLRFISAPFVHWPETMMTYEESQRILFSCDAFGGYGAVQGSIFDDASIPVAWYEEQALRYFSNIVATYSKPVRTAVSKLAGVPLAVVAPSHGLVWRNRPLRIVDLYERWANFAMERGETVATILYASMYGGTEGMMGAVAQGIGEEGVPVKIFNVITTPVSFILPALWTSQGVMVGAPTYEGGLFPRMNDVLELARRKRVFNKDTAYFGSHAWNGGAQKEFQALAESMRWKILGNLEFNGMPHGDALKDGRAFGADFARALKLGEKAAPSIHQNQEG